jgi:endogenous inhibitor of DNA gyrase (YacG/DUF329 family)
METLRRCPICKRPIAEGEAAKRYRPFCSRRCADIDLGRWLKGSYAIPAAGEDADEAAAAGAEDGEGEGEGGAGRH